MPDDPSALAPRSILRLRARPHMYPDRADDVIVEVVRDGEVVGTIYGSREGVQIVSNSFRNGARRVISTDVRGGAPGLVVPLLRPGEPCPWCADQGKIAAGEHASMDCPICKVVDVAGKRTTTRAEDD